MDKTSMIMELKLDSINRRKVKYCPCGKSNADGKFVPFKNAEKLRRTIKKLPNNKIFFETDAPYLAPVPMRGEINKPSLLRHIIEYYCELTEKDFDNIANIASKNYERFISCQT